MADYLVTDTELTSIADAIRTKGGTSGSLVYPAGFVSAIDAIPTGGGSGLEYETGTYTPESDVLSTEVTINFANSHTNAPCFIVIVDQTGVYDSTTYTQYYWSYIDHYLLFGNPIYYSSTGGYYAQGYSRARATSVNSLSSNGINLTSTTDQRVSNEYFKPYYSSSYYYRAGHTYKWMAVWGPTT